MKSTAMFMAFALLAASAAQGGEMVNKDDRDIAISGYDPVAYHTLAAPTPGDPDIRHTWHDAVWQFASVENRDLFITDPERYAPRFGGFCAGAMSFGRVGEIDPEIFVIIEGALFLGGREEVPGLLSNEPEKHITSATENWRTLGTTN